MLRVSAIVDGGQVGLHQIVIGGVEHDVARRRQADEFGQGERGLRGAAAGRDHHFGDLRLPQRCQRVVGDVGARQRIRIGRQDAGDVECHVAVADDDHPLVAQIDWEIGVFGMAVDPGDHLGGRTGAGQSHAVDVEPAVVRRADGIQHGVVVGQQVGMRHVRSHLDVEEEREAPPAGDLVEQPGDPLGALMVGGHSRRAPDRRASAAFRRR